MQRKLRKTQYEYDIIRPIGQGTFNCATLIRRSNGEKQVLRIALLPKEPEATFANMKVKRGIQIVNIFQKVKGMLGPSLLIEKEPFEFRSVKMSELRLDQTKLCSKIIDEARTYDEQNVPYEFAIQVIEYLNAGFFNHDSFLMMGAEEHVFACFSLLWFMHHAQSKFDFGHHDLKPLNIVFKRTNVPQTFTFYIERNHFVFKSKFVPVIIDYDFATVLTSRDPQDKHIMGTMTNVSPDALLREIQLRTETLDTVDPDILAAHDWWSIGVALLQFSLPSLNLGRDNVDLFPRERIAYQEHVMSKLESLDNIFVIDDEATRLRVESVLLRIPAACALACLVSEGNTLVPPKDSPAYTLRNVFFANESAELLDAIVASRDFRWLREEYAKLPRELRDITRMLLSWYPEKRHYMNHPYMYLFELYFRPYKILTDEPDAPGAFIGEAMGLMEDDKYHNKIDDATYPLLAACMTCGINSNIALCVCCDAIFCSTKCQDAHHEKTGFAIVAGKRTMEEVEEEEHVPVDFANMSQEQKEDLFIQMIQDLNSEEDEARVERKYRTLLGLADHSEFERITEYSFDQFTSNTYAEMIGMLSESEVEALAEIFKDNGMRITDSLILKAWRLIDDLYAETLELMKDVHDLGMIETYYSHIPVEIRTAFTEGITKLKDHDSSEYELLELWKSKEFQKINRQAYKHASDWVYAEIKTRKYMSKAYRLQQLITRPNYWPERFDEMVVFRAYKEDNPDEDDVRGHSFDSIKERFASGEQDIILTYDGFLATSSVQPPGNFIGQTCCLMIIHIPPHVPVIMIDEGTSVVDESEVLLPAGISLKVIDVGVIVAYNRTIKTAIFEVVGHTKVTLL